MVDDVNKYADKNSYKNGNANGDTEVEADGVGVLVGVWEKVGVPYADVEPDDETMGMTVWNADEDHDTEAIAVAVVGAAGVQIGEGSSHARLQSDSFCRCQ